MINREAGADALSTILATGYVWLYHLHPVGEYSSTKPRDKTYSHRSGGSSEENHGKSSLLVL